MDGLESDLHCNRWKKAECAWHRRLRRVFHPFVNAPFEKNRIKTNKFWARRAMCRWLITIANEIISSVSFFFFPLSKKQQIKDELCEVVSEMESHDSENKHSSKEKQMSIGRKKFNMDPKKGIKILPPSWFNLIFMLKWEKSLDNLSSWNIYNHGWKVDERFILATAAPDCWIINSLISSLFSFFVFAKPKKRYRVSLRESSAENWCTGCGAIPLQRRRTQQNRNWWEREISLQRRGINSCGFSLH